jgi:hypothetical protein
MLKNNEWSRLVNKIFLPQKFLAEAVFVHAWNDLREEIIDLTAKTFYECDARTLILNGLNEFETGEPGFTYWKNALVQRGISAESILETTPAVHTGIEAKELALLINKYKISTVAIISVPMHIVRAFLTDLATINKDKNPTVQLLPLTLPSINWLQEIEIKSISGLIERTTRLGRFADEFKRILDYQAESKANNPNFKIATFQEGIAHLHL